MNRARAAKRWYWQRISAMAMTLFVLVHLAVIVLAIRGGLSAAEILSRTRGNLGWMLFYGVFVALVALHAAIGLRNVLDEWAPARKVAGLASTAAALLLLALGWRAVAAVTWGG